MSLDWQTFKSALGQNVSVTYIDEEDSEIPIDSECEFQEALRLARLHKKFLRIIVYDHKSQPSQKRYLELFLIRFTNPEEKFVLTKMNETSNGIKQTREDVKESCCHCREGGEPEWFSQYMKKFKKQLFHELRTHIQSAVYSAIEKERKSTARSDTHDVVCKKRESLFPGSAQIKKEKLDKDPSDLIDQREAKLQRKLEKLLTSRSERLEKLDNKIFRSSNEDWLLREARLHSKRKLNRTRKGVHDKSEGCASVPTPGRKITAFSGLHPELKCPTQKSRKAPKSEEPLRMRCTVVDGEEAFGAELGCEGRTEPFAVEGKPSGTSGSSKESQGTAGETRNAVGALIDFEKDIITSSQKKIEENIMEIQKRLHDIDLLGPLTSAESNAKENRISENEEKWKTGYDLLQDLDQSKGKDLKQKLEQENVQFGIDCLSLNQPLKEAPKSNTSEEKGHKKPDNLQDNAESEHYSDSDLSVIFVSEEEEEEEDEEGNFVVIPSKSPSPANSVNEDKISPERESEARKEQPEVTKAKTTNETEKETEQPKQEEEEEEDVVCQSNSRSRRSPFGEETFKAKKIKSKSTEYHFSTENLTNPTFIQYPEGIFGGRPSAFTFTAGKEDNSQREAPEKREDRKEGQSPKAFDALGRVIYAVNNNGHCLPVESMLRREEQTTRPTGVSSGVPPSVPPDEGRRSAERVFGSQQQERRSDRPKETPSVSILPNALMNGASNVASMAFNTAKSVINNLKKTSAFVTEGRTEMRQPAFDPFQDRRVSNETLIRLCDMGFMNIELNRQLLLLNGNNLAATVEELIRLQQFQNDTFW